ncbi:MAG: thiamine pyrophosphate-binding protein [Pseudomonadota bacterium]
MLKQALRDTPREYRNAPSAVSRYSGQEETVATYLNKRLREIGVGHVFCIPGDYVAEWCETLDEPEQSAGLVRVHPNNEMCATYAADGYGRATNDSVGCVAFTYGVGGINAAQAVAGAYVEQVPLVVINGSPSVAQFNSERDQGVLYHHMVDGSHSDLRIFNEITEMAVRIDNPATAPALIDAALQTCITTSKPVYLELANLTSNMRCEPVPDTPLTRAPLPASTPSVTEATNAVLAHLKQAKRVVVLGGSEIARHGLQDSFTRVLQLIDAPYATSPLGKSVISEFRTDVRFAGVYFGKSSPPNLQHLMEGADCVVALGVLDTDFNYLGVVTPDYNPDAASELPGPTHIQARRGAVLVGRGLAYWGDVDLASLLQALGDKIEASGSLPNAPFPGLEGSPWQIPEPDHYGTKDPITYDSFKSCLYHDYLEGHDEVDYPQIVADSGFSFLSNIDLKAPEGGYIAQLAWAAIGYGVGATAGVTLANSRAGKSRRTVTITGDAAFAEALNALGTVAQLGQDAVFFVMDNRVYAVEQWLIDANAFAGSAPPPHFKPLTEVPQGYIWDYVKLAEGFGGVGYSVTTNAELREVLARLNSAPENPVTKQPTFTLIAVRLPQKDLPANARWKITK